MFQDSRLIKMRKNNRPPFAPRRQPKCGFHINPKCFLHFYPICVTIQIIAYNRVSGFFSRAIFRHRQQQRYCRSNATFAQKFLFRIARRDVVFLYFLFGIFSFFFPLYRRFCINLHITYKYFYVLYVRFSSSYRFSAPASNYRHVRRILVFRLANKKIDYILLFRFCF